MVSVYATLYNGSFKALRMLGVVAVCPLPEDMDESGESGRVQDYTGNILMINSAERVAEDSHIGPLFV